MFHHNLIEMMDVVVVDNNCLPLLGIHLVGLDWDKWMMMMMRPCLVLVDIHQIVGGW